MAGTLIDKTNIWGTPTSNIFNILDTRTNVADPRDPQNLKIRTFVYDTDAKVKALDFSSYPYIILEQATIAPPTNKRADHKTEKLTWRNTIIVRTARDGSGNNRSDTGLSDMRTIVNSIIQTFKNETNKTTLRTYNMYDVDIFVDDVGFINIDQKGLHETILGVEYKTHLTVST